MRLKYFQANKCGHSASALSRLVNFSIIVGTGEAGHLGGQLQESAGPYHHCIPPPSQRSLWHSKPCTGPETMAACTYKMAIIPLTHVSHIFLFTAFACFRDVLESKSERQPSQNRISAKNLPMIFFSDGSLLVDLELQK